MFKGGILSVLVSVLTGCGGQTAFQPTSQGTSPEGLGIINGKDVTAPDTYSGHVVYLQFRLAEGVGSCTGSILDSQTILTAAHCVSGATEGVVVFANNVQDPSAVAAEYVRSVDVASVYPKYKAEPEDSARAKDPASIPPPDQVPSVREFERNLDQSGFYDYDVAVVHFSGGLPAGYSPVQLADSGFVVETGAELHMIGYGLAKVNAVKQLVKGQVIVTPSPDGSTAGQLRETSVPIAAYDVKTGVLLTAGTKTSVCSGDSGGPAFVADPKSGAAIQVGIAEAVATSYCNSVSMHTAVFPYLGWIKEMSAKMAAKAAAAG